MSSYSFPILKTAEINSLFRELNIPAAPELLSKPTEAAVRPVYAEFVEILGDLRREDCEQPQFSAMAVLSFPEIHEASIAEMGFLRALQRLMAAVGLSDFSMGRDLMKPEPKRTVRNFSAIINFAKFREERMARYHELAQESEELLEERARGEEENARLSKQLVELRARRDEQQPYRQQLQQETEAMAEEVGELNNRQFSLTKEIKDLKEISNEYADRVANSRFLILSANEECQSLQSQIVQSPEKLKKHLTETASAVEEERSAVEQAEAQVVELQYTRECLHKIEKSITKSITAMDDVDTELTKAKAAKKTLKATTSEIEKNEEELREQKNAHQTMRRQNDQAKDKTSRANRDGERALRDMQNRVSTARQEVSGLEHRKKDTQARIDQTEAVCRDMKENIQRLQREHDAEVAGMRALCTRLSSQVEGYHTHMLRKMRVSAV